MVFIVTALKIEAEPLIEHFKLKKIWTYTVFQCTEILILHL